MRKTVLNLMLLSTVVSTELHADRLAYRCKEPHPSSVVLKAALDRGACSGFVVHKGSQLIQEVSKVWLGSGTLLVNDDGRSVIFVQDYPLARLKDKRIQALDDKPLYGVIIFRDSKEVGRYTIDQLLSSTKGLKQSVSHVSWVGSFDSKIESVWHLKTSAGDNLRFDSVTGQLNP